MLPKTNLYLELLKRALNNYLYLGGGMVFEKYEITQLWDSDWKIPESSRPHSLLAAPKFNALQLLMHDVVENNVPGDFIETGIYKGGTAIFMRAFLKVNNITDRIVWAADSFEGIPLSKKYMHIDDPVDKWQERWVAGYQEVENNFRRYDLLDDQIRFIRGYFADTLPSAPFSKLAIARLDGDSYESTMDALEGVFPRMSPGGYVIIDDWHISSCRQAVNDYRKANGITDPINTVLGGTHDEVTHEAFWRVDENPVSAHD